MDGRCSRHCFVVIMVVVVACGQWLLFVVIVIAFIYRSPRLVIQLELCPSLSCHHALSTFFWTLPSFVWLGAIVRQTDPSSYTYISLHTRFVGFCGLLTTGRLRFYHSPMPLSFLFLHWRTGREVIQLAGSRRHRHLCDVFEPVFFVIFPSPSSSPLHFKTQRRFLLFW